MAKYMLNICYGSRATAEHPADDDFIMDKYRAWGAVLGERIQSAHKLVDGTGRKVVKNGSAIVEGPYVETKESIGGYYIIEASSLEEATKLAQGCPTVQYQNGFVEVREVEF